MKTGYKIGIGVLLIGAMIGGIWFIKRKKKETKQVDNTQITPGAGTINITNHDSVYDYKLENNEWFTKHKLTGVWLNMKNALNPEMYKTAVSRLENYLIAHPGGDV